MNSPAYTYTLSIGIVIALLALLTGASTYSLPGNQQGYQPLQPIAFSHQLHAGELSIDCQYCHTGAETSRHAGIPAASVCMNCHKVVTSSWGAVMAEDKRIEELKKQAAEDNKELTSEQTVPQQTISDELRKLYDALALNDERIPDPGKSPELIEWVKVHHLPDFVYFDHRGHIDVGIECQTCHGEVESMQQIRQVESLSMGWCVNCHRESNQTGINGKQVNASLNCTTCHY